jgi:hypothetical protein
MAVYVLHHEHEPDECPAAYAAWHGFDSPLRRHPAPSTCLTGGHAIWWQVEAPGPAAALALLPGFVARRTRAIRVRDVGIP